MSQIHAENEAPPRGHLTVDTFKGLVYVRQGRVGTKSEGPDYYLQTTQGDFLLRYEQRHPQPPARALLLGILTEAARNLLDELHRSGVVPIVNKHDIGTFGHIAMAAACLFGLACATVGGTPGMVAAVWSGVTLIGAGRKVGPQLGMTTFGLAALYGLAAASGFGGTDPEDVDPHTSLRLAVVAVGCTVIGITSALVWIADRLRRDR